MNDVSAAPPGADPLRGLAAWAMGFWVAWMAILPLGHVTALRTALALPVCALAIALAVRRGGWQAIGSVPALPLWLALLFWCGLSSLWSPAPDVTWSKFRFDLLLPFIAYLGGYFLARFVGSSRYLLLGPLLGAAMLALMSVFAWVPPPGWITTFIEFGTFRPMPQWYPGVGEASAWSVLLFGPLLAWCVLARRAAGAWARWAPLLLIFLVVAIIVATNRRNALIVPLLITPLFFMLLGRAGKPVPRKVIALAVAGFILAIGIVGCVLEFGARERLSPEQKAAMPSHASAALTMIRGEPRPKIWAYYVEKARQNLWIGVGFGRTVPALAYDTKSNAALLAIDVHAGTHAHNLALNWLLQTGVIGLALFAALVATVGRLAWRARLQSQHHRLLACATLTTLAAMLLRNMTDDFMVYGIATAFWAIVGMLLGLLDRRHLVVTKAV